jgi:competence protein ComFC
MFEKILAFIFPSQAPIAHLESMSPAIFSAYATRVQDELPLHIHSLFHYKDPYVRQALWALKYQGNKKIARLFAALLYESMIEIISEASLYENFSDPIIIPLPLSIERLKERGWNQSEILAQEITKIFPELHYEKDILKKIKHTAPQTSLSRKERIHNLKNCFAVPHEKRSAILNRNIILIDDVTTTGSTIIEARSTLLKAGARRVIAFTVAH